IAIGGRVAGVEHQRGGELRDRALGIALGGVGDAAVDKGILVARIEGDRPIVVGNRLVVVALHPVGVGAVVVDDRAGRVAAERFAVVGDRLVVVLAVRVRVAAIDVVADEIGLALVAGPDQCGAARDAPVGRGAIAAALRRPGRAVAARLHDLAP